VNDYVDAGNGASLNPTTAISFSAWVRPASISITGSNMVIGKYATSVEYLMRLQNPGTVRSNVRNFGVDSNATLAVNTWYHLVATFDGAQMNFYVNGMLDRSVSGTANMSNRGANVNIGRRSSGGSHFSGLIDEV